MIVFLRVVIRNSFLLFLNNKCFVFKKKSWVLLNNASYTNGKPFCRTYIRFTRNKNHKNLKDFCKQRQKLTNMCCDIFCKREIKRVYVLESDFPFVLESIVQQNSRFIISLEIHYLLIFNKTQSKMVEIIEKMNYLNFGHVWGLLSLTDVIQGHIFSKLFIFII